MEVFTIINGYDTFYSNNLMAADKEAIGLPRDHLLYSKCNPPSQDVSLLCS